MNIERVFRERHYWRAGCRKWFESCPVIKQSPKFIKVRSENYPALQYPGGEFRLEVARLLADGVHHHTRHGERFWLEQPCQGDLFPSEELMGTPLAIEYEAMAVGWLEPGQKWHSLPNFWQRELIVIAMELDHPLRQIIDRWKFGGESALQQMWAEVRTKNGALFSDFMRDA